MTLARIFEFARTTPKRIAFTLDGQPITYVAFARRIASARTFLVTQNLPAEGLIIVCMSDLADAWSTVLALHSLGHVTACIGGIPELRHFEKDKIGSVIVRGGERRPALPDVARKMGFRHFEMPADLAAGDNDEGLALKWVSSGGHLVFTSGTTGVIKKILIDTANEDAHIAQRLEAFDIKPDSIVNMFDWARWSSVGYTVPLGVWSLGARLVFCKKMKKRESLAYDGTTHAISTPDMVAEIATSAPGAVPRQNAFRLYVGGGPLPQALADAALARITKQLYTMVGSTEAGVWCVTPIRSAPDVTSHVIAPSRVVEVVDDDGKPLPPGETGLVRIRVLKNTTKYFGDEETTQNFFRNGFFFPGDLGVFDATGRLTLQGRVTDIVYAKGMKLAVAPLERRIQDRLGALDVCIFSAQIGRLDEELWVAVQGTPSLDDAALKVIASEELARFPRVHFRFLPEFPKNDRGKVMRNELKEKVLSRQGSPAPR